jgi:sigma-E factor negative regulatory protein RseA
MKEKLSAMFDGDVDEATARVLLNRLKCDATFRDDWDTYCLLGDVIRTGAPPPPEMEGFTTRVMARLESEPTLFLPHRREHGERRGGHRILHGRLMQIAASVMGVLAVGGVVVALSGGPGGPVAPVEVAKVATPQSAPAHRAPGPGNARYDFLVAHQTLAGGPMPSAVQYVRTVSTTAEE